MFVLLLEFVIEHPDVADDHAIEHAAPCSVRLTTCG
jgi:hypothetical protein